MLTILHLSRQFLWSAWTKEHLVHECAIALGHSIKLSTYTTYYLALQSYLIFCKLHNFPIDSTPDMLSFYTIYMCHHIQPCSVGSYLLGICNQLEPYFPHVQTVCTLALVSYTLTGAQKYLSMPTTWKKPLSIENLLVIIQLYPHSGYDDTLFLILTLCGFFGLYWLGKLTCPNNTHLHDYQKLIK